MLLVPHWVLLFHPQQKVSQTHIYPNAARANACPDPKLVWMYTGLSGITFVVAMLFWFLFRHLNATEDRMNALDGRAMDVGFLRNDNQMDEATELRTNPATGKQT
jgi:hypothetical protein